MIRGHEGDDAVDFNWGSFLIGLVAGAIGAFATGFLQKAGEDTWLQLKRRLFPYAPEPIAVPNDFDPHIYQQGNFAWVPDASVHEKEVEGYTYFIHPNGQARCYRELSNRREFLMRRPT
jgi:hypothetical protein